MRIDKFIWCVRLSKTRSIATDLVQKGKVKLNEAGVKPSKEVKVGDVLSVSKNSAVFTYKVIGLLDKRVGAALVLQFISDVTPIEEVEKYRNYQLAQSVYRQLGEGKPTKKDRRNLDEFLDNWK